MKIDITSLCFGFKIEKENDSGTPAWATSIGQAPKDICYVDTKIEGLSDFIYGMMYKSHSDFENLKDRDIPGLDKREEPRSKRDRMMFSVFEKVFVNGKKVDGIYTLTFEKEHSQNHENRLHICYAKYLTYNGHSNKTTLTKMTEVLGCNSDACWFVDDITIKNQSDLHFHAFVVNPNHTMTYASSKQRQKEWDSIANGNYIVIFGPTKYGTNKFNYPSLLKEALQLLVKNRSDIFESTNDVLEVRDNKVFIAGCQVGWDKNKLEGVREDKYDDSFEWEYNGVMYYPNKELGGEILKGFVDLFNELLDKKFAILSDKDNNDKCVYTIIQYIHQNTDKASEEKLQQIFYGAPGTGKSHKIKDDENVKIADEKELVYRTTFHPDSDYSTFVGAYKPTMKPVADKYKAVAGKDEEITYAFIPQAFLQAYVAAWNNPDDNVYLVIEEINRGNCAQIFGDLFQLLDRKDSVSEYPIMADRDLVKYLNGKDEKGLDVLTNKEGIKNGKLCLPKNLYIWATMNTSDQSLFPIDSAFKRRWDWVYIPIKNHEEENYKINIGDAKYDWWGFLEKINKVIGQVTSSEDKKLGYFFVKADNKVVDANKFVCKVLFYLWNDVFKNYGFENAIFSRGENNIFTFSDFFDKKGEPNTLVVNEFLKKLDETIDKEYSFVSVDNEGSPSSLIINYNGETIEGDSAVSKYVDFVSFIAKEKGEDAVANCLGADFIQNPPEGTKRRFQLIGDSGWHLAKNIGIDAMKDNIKKIKKTLGVDVVIG